MNVQQTCSRLLYPCGHLSMDVTVSGRTWSGRLRTGHYSRQSCWQRRARVVGDSYSRYSRDNDTCITFSNRSCRLQPRPPHDKVYSCRHARASTTLRSHSVQGSQYDLADCFEHVQNNRRGLPLCQDLPESLKFYKAPLTF